MLRDLMPIVGRAVVLSAFIAAPAMGQIPAPSDPEAVLSDVYTGKSYSPYAGRGFPSQPYWGDTHVHTGLSLDAASSAPGWVRETRTDSLAARS